MFHVKRLKMHYQQVSKKNKNLQLKLYKNSIKKEYIIKFIYSLNYIV